MQNLDEPEARIQSCKHISASIVFGVNRLRKYDIIFTAFYHYLTVLLQLLGGEAQPLSART